MKFLDTTFNLYTRETTESVFWPLSTPLQHLLVFTVPPLTSTAIDLLGQLHETGDSLVMIYLSFT